MVQGPLNESRGPILTRNFISRKPFANFHEKIAQLALKQLLNSHESQFRILHNECKFDAVILSWID